MVRPAYIMSASIPFIIWTSSIFLDPSSFPLQGIPMFRENQLKNCYRTMQNMSHWKWQCSPSIPLSLSITLIPSPSRSCVMDVAQLYDMQPNTLCHAPSLNTSTTGRQAGRQSVRQIVFLLAKIFDRCLLFYVPWRE